MFLNLKSVEMVSEGDDEYVSDNLKTVTSSKKTQSAGIKSITDHERKMK